MLRRAPPFRRWIASLGRIASLRRAAALGPVAARKPIGRRRAPALALALGLGGAPALAAAPAWAASEEKTPAPVIYRWVDENGVPHYTAQRDRIPAAVRGSVREVRPDATAPAAPSAPAASAPAPAEAWISRDAGAGPATGGAAPLPAAAPATSEPAVAPAPPAGPVLGAASPAPARSAPGGAAGSELDQRIAALEAEIERDEEALKTLLSEPAGPGGLADQPAFREIAKRLPQRQAALRDLRDQRSRLGRP